MNIQRGKLIQKTFENIVGNGERTGVTFVLMSGKKEQRMSVATESYFKGIMLNH